MPIALVLPFWNILSSHVLSIFNDISIVKHFPFDFQAPPEGRGKPRLPSPLLKQGGFTADFGNSTSNWGNSFFE